MGQTRSVVKKKIKTVMSERHENGIKICKKVFGKRGDYIIQRLSGLSPDLARLYTEIPFVDIYSRGILDLKTRELLAIAALTCLGDSELQLETHIYGALNSGCRPEEIYEAVLHMVPFIGFPRAINGMKLVKKICR